MLVLYVSAARRGPRAQAEPKPEPEPEPRDAGLRRRRQRGAHGAELGRAVHRDGKRVAHLLLRGPDLPQRRGEPEQRPHAV